jgi:hypothetical protein
MADFDAPRRHDEYEEYGDVGAKDFKFGVTGILLAAGAAILLAIFA